MNRAINSFKANFIRSICSGINWGLLLVDDEIGFQGLAEVHVSWSGHFIRKERKKRQGMIQNAKNFIQVLMGCATEENSHYAVQWQWPVLRTKTMAIAYGKWNRSIAGAWWAKHKTTDPAFSHESMTQLFNCFLVFFLITQTCPRGLKKSKSLAKTEKT